MKLFTLASAMSLVLCLGMVALWVRSYWTPLEIESTLPIREPEPLPNTDEDWPRDCGKLLVIHYQGEFYWRHSQGAEHPSDYGLRVSEPVRIFRQSVARFAGSGPRAGHHLPGFRFWNEGANFVLIGHDSAIVSIFCLLPVLWVFLRIKPHLPRLHRSGTCKKCGYDLRATPGRCPECGHVPDTAQATA